MSRKLTAVITAVIIMLVPIATAAGPMPGDMARMVTPTLSSISFKNAVINEKFEPTVTQYTITLDDPEETPTLNDYAIDGDANIFVTYSTDETRHQTGIVATLEFEGGTTIYTFEYANAQQYAISSNNLLADVDCYLGEVYPRINDKDTDYKLFIPEDMSSIRLTAITKDVSAYCDALDEIALNPSQEPSISITVTASDGSTRAYTFKVKRLNESCEQIAARIAEPGFTSLVEGQLYYQKPSFFIAITSTAGGVLVLMVMVMIAKRLTVKAEDEDETEFFDI